MPENLEFLNQFKKDSDNLGFSRVTHITGHISYDKLIVYLTKFLNLSLSEIIILKPEEKKSIGISQVRQFKKRLMESAGSKNQLALIFKGEAMTAEAQNCLLKVVEELPKAIFLLIFSESDSLLSTLKSRVIKTIQLKSDSSIDSYQLEQEFLAIASLLERLEWIEAKVPTFDLNQFLKNLLKVLDQKKSNYLLKSEILTSLKLVQANLNQKLILDLLALKITRQNDQETLK